jgi:ubiquinone/menaquinone biosynthesis C-methylase UbiE
MLAVAQSRLQRFENAELRLIGGDNLSLETDSIDIVFSNMYLHHTSNPVAAMMEMVRVLAPGGQLVITDIEKHDHEWMRREMADVWLGFERSAFGEWLAELGLVNIDIEGIGSQCHAMSDQGAVAAISIIVACATKPNRRMKAEVERRYNALAHENAVQYGISIPYYSAEEMRLLPSDALVLSRGCGNPVALANLCVGETVIDLGCGAGIDVFLAAKKVGESGQVIGVDLAEGLLNKAREAGLKTGIGAVSFVGSDIEALPFACSQVDVAISNCAINLADDKVRVFQEMFRILRNGGRLSAFDIVTDAPLPRSLRNKPAEWVRCLAGALTREEYAHLLTQAGFVEVTVGHGEMAGLYGEVGILAVPILARKP